MPKRLSGAVAESERLAPGIRLDRVALADLEEDPDNERQHDGKNIEAIAASLSEFGQVLPLLVKGRRIIGGHGTKRAMESLGWTHADVARAEHLTDVQVRGLRIALNRTAELATWDQAALHRSLQELAAFRVEWPKTLGFTAVDLQSLSAAVASMGPAAPSNEEASAPLVVEPITNLGDLWILGDHRLLCGDATIPDDVARLLDGAVPLLMVTDPPYGVEYDPAQRQGIARESHGDVKRTGDVRNDDRADWSAAYKLFPGDVAYVWHASWYTPDVARGLDDQGFVRRSLIIWRKQQFAFSRGHYHWQHEPAWYAVRRGKSARWSGDRKQTTVWDITTNSGYLAGRNETTHGTEKPLECMARPIRNHGKEGDGVYDPFVGSGTTIVAAEQLKRRCFALEIDPAYCDMAVARWQKLTGRKAERIAAGAE